MCFIVQNISDWKTLRSSNYAKLFKIKQDFLKHKVFIRIVLSESVSSPKLCNSAAYHLVPLSHRSSSPFPVQYISAYFQDCSIPLVQPLKKILYPSMHFKLTEGEAFLLCRRIHLMQITKYYEVLIFSLSM